MERRPKKRAAAKAALALWMASAAALPVAADDTDGLARITDQPNAMANDNDDPQDDTKKSSSGAAGVASGYYYPQPSEAAWASNYPNPGNHRDGINLYYHHYKGHGPARSQNLFGTRIYDGQRRKHYPMYGWSKPVTTPIERGAIEYTYYWPNPWWGQPNAGLQPQFQMVHTPTDTTQLGYYYQTVPSWQPQPGMLPPPPNPVLWHRRLNPAAYYPTMYGNTNYAPMGYAGGQGQIYYADGYSTGSVPADVDSDGPTMAPESDAPEMLEEHMTPDDPASPPVDSVSFPGAYILRTDGEE